MIDGGVDLTTNPVIADSPLIKTGSHTTFILPRELDANTPVGASGSPTCVNFDEIAPCDGPIEFIAFTVKI